VAVLNLDKAVRPAGFSFQADKSVIDDAGIVPWEDEGEIIRGRAKCAESEPEEHRNS
jgi:hypothetical protein